MQGDRKGKNKNTDLIYFPEQNTGFGENFTKVTSYNKHSLNDWHKKHQRG